MAWFKVDDQLAMHPKVLQAGNAAMGLWVRAGAWCAAHLTDGSIPVSMIRALGAQTRDAKRLVEVGLWSREGDHYRFKDWHDYQPTKAQVSAEREANKRRVQRFRSKDSNGVGNGVTDTVTNGVSNGTPVPSRPEVTKVTSEKGTQKRATRLPESWEPTPEHHTRAADTKLDLEREVAKFRAHAAQNERTAKNWNAAFTSWLIRADEYAQRDRQRTSGNSYSDRTMNVLRQEHERAVAADKAEAEQLRLIEGGWGR